MNTTHVKTWSGSRSATLTDMTNAGKRGKVCRTLRFQGVPWDEWNGDPQKAVETLAAKWTGHVLRCIVDRIERVADVPFDEAAGMIRWLVAEARAVGVPEGYLGYYEETIRGVDAPVEVLSCSCDKWSGHADQDGICLNDRTDQNNLPCEITYGQSKNKAYQIARKCWAEVIKATSMHEADSILTAHGARLHYFCRMD